MHPITFALSAIGTAIAGMYMGSSLLGLLAISFAALALVQNSRLKQVLGHTVTQPNKVEASATTQTKDGKKEWVFIVKYQHPENFNKLTFKYPRNEACFTSYRVQIKYNNDSNDFGRKTDIGTQGSDNKHELVLVPGRYTKTSSKWIETITIQFFQPLSTDTTVNQCYADRFKKLLQKGAFYAYQQNTNTAQIIDRVNPSSSVWTTDPSVFV